MSLLTHTHALTLQTVIAGLLPGRGDDSDVRPGFASSALDLEGRTKRHDIKDAGPNKK